MSAMSLQHSGVQRQVIATSRCSRGVSLPIQLATAAKKAQYQYRLLNECKSPRRSYASRVVVSVLPLKLLHAMVSEEFDEMKKTIAQKGFRHIRTRQLPSAKS